MPFLPAAAALLGLLGPEMKAADPQKGWKLHAHWHSIIFQKN
jgi:hypothetical protein